MIDDQPAAGCARMAFSIMQMTLCACVMVCAIAFTIMFVWAVVFVK